MSTFEVIRGVEGDCLVLDGMRIAGPKPWGGGRVIKEWNVKETYVPEETCRVTDTGFATVVCSECGCEYMGSIITNEPPDYVKPLERCPNCGRRVIA